MMPAAMQAVYTWKELSTFTGPEVPDDQTDSQTLALAVFITAVGGNLSVLKTTFKSSVKKNTNSQKTLKM